MELIHPIAILSINLDDRKKQLDEFPDDHPLALSVKVQLKCEIKELKQAIEILKEYQTGSI